MITKAQKSYDPHDIDEAIEAFDKEIGNYGIEAIEGNKYVDSYYMNINLLYSNAGDTYDKTLIYDTLNQKFIVSDWGTIVERNPRRFR